MAEFPALPLWTDAYLGDTTHLTTFEHGAYLLLLMVSWRSPDCALPDDDLLLAKYTRMRVDKWRRIRPVMASFFIIQNGVWSQKRLRAERDFVSQLRESRAAGGRTSALKRKDRVSTEQPFCSSTPPTPTPTPTPKEERISVSKDTSPHLPSDCEHVILLWNEMAERLGLAPVRKLTAERRTKLRIRLGEHGAAMFGEAIAAVEHSAFCCGDNDRGWRADFDFLLQPKSFMKLVEGSYNGKPKTNAILTALAAVRAEAAAEREAERDDPGAWSALPSNIH